MTKRGDLWQRGDRGLLLALLIGAIAAWPFFANPSLPAATDAELHIFRIAEVGYSLRAGNLYPRWAANFYYGYGYPIFNYYAPLTYHLGNWVTGFHPERAVAGAKILFIGAAFLGAVGAYLLGREFGGQGGGVLGAATFAFAPYIMLVNPHVRGDLAEVFALAIVPWALWSWERLWNNGGKAMFVTAVVTVAATLLSHNLTGLTTVLLLMTLSAWHWLIGKHHSRARWAFLAGVLAALLTAFFWLPFLLERKLIRLNVAGEGHYDFRNHFVLLRDLLAFIKPIDWRAATNNPPMSAGPLLIILAVAGFVVALIWHRQAPQFRRLGFYLSSSLLCFWLITPGSRQVWETIPGMAYYQFPWRFLGPLAALLVPLVAALGNVRLPHKTRVALLTFLCGIILITALPGLYPIPWPPDFGPVNPLTLLDFELQGRWRGTTSTDDFIPTTVDVIPGPAQSLLDSYQSPPIDRINHYTISDDTTVTALADVPWRNRFAVRAPRETLLRLFLFDFPGWKAYVDGQETAITIAKPEGLITLKVPAGEHEVLLRFEDTPPRTAGWLIAGTGLIAFFVAVWRFPGGTAEPVKAKNETGLLTWLAVCLVSMFLLKPLLFDYVEWFHYTSPPGEARAARYRQSADFGGEIALLGFDLSSTQLKPGDTLDVTVYWNAQRVMSETYQSFVHVVYPEGRIWTQSDHLNPAGFPTNQWPTDRYIRDQHRLVLPPDIPEGEYSISVGIYLLHNNTRLPVLHAESGARADNVILGKTINVRR
ncbi:MAG: 6-pyruvoyl-tetrahydropterin synthase-related protein [Anaerolineae bacterium]